MHEDLKALAKNYTEYDFKCLLGSKYEDIKKYACEIIMYMDDVTPEAANQTIEESDILAAIFEALVDEGVLCELDNEGVKVVNPTKMEDLVANKIWVANVLPTKIYQTAKSKSDAKIERNACKHKVVAGKDGKFGIPGHEYCSLWKVNVGHVIQIDGKCVPIKFFGQSQMIERRPSMWGTQTPEWGYQQLDRMNVKSASINKKARVIKKDDKWALVSKDDDSKALKYWDKKPSDEEVAKEERRVNYFEHKSAAKNINLRLSLPETEVGWDIFSQEAQKAINDMASSQGVDIKTSSVFFECSMTFYQVQSDGGVDSEGDYKFESFLIAVVDDNVNEMLIDNQTGGFEDAQPEWLLSEDGFNMLFEKGGVDAAE